jgi:cyclic pyranopterin monophosphate synthase
MTDKIPGGLRAGHAEQTAQDPTDLTHVDEHGAVRMVDVSAKPDTAREAVAEGFIAMHPDTLALIVEGRAAKGDVLATARVAGIMGAKQTSSIIPMCHPLNITKAKVELKPISEGMRTDGRVGLQVTATTGVTGKTGIEMEALCACSIACLTVYDMCKAVDRGMEIGEIHLLRKEGGRSGLWTREV